jgi:hypothetical protein
VRRGPLGRRRHRRTHRRLRGSRRLLAAGGLRDGLAPAEPDRAVGERRSVHRGERGGGVVARGEGDEAAVVRPPPLLLRPRPHDLDADHLPKVRKGGKESLLADRGREVAYVQVGRERVNAVEVGARGGDGRAARARRVLRRLAARQPRLAPLLLDF